MAYPQNVLKSKPKHQRCQTSMTAAKGEKAIGFDSWKYEHYIPFILSKSKNIWLLYVMCRKQDILQFKNIKVKPHKLHVDF